jgi:MFS family permease
MRSWVYALGAAQVISWGTLFYAIGVLGPHMRRELGVSELAVFGAFTLALVTSGTLAPSMGRLLDRRGGRFVLCLGSVLGALSLVILAAATHAFMVFAGWIVAGAAMAACLYDPAFATLSQDRTLDYRKALTVLTIMGGFASTTFWPISHLLVDAIGWRGTWMVFAFLHIAVCLPLHLRFVPRPSAAMASPENTRPAGWQRSPSAALRWLTAAFALASFTLTVIAVHVVGILSSSGLTEAEAIAIAMLIGPMQVVGRILEFRIAGSAPGTAVGFTPFFLFLVALAALAAVNGAGVAAVVFAIAFGFGNGILTITRGNVPRQLFGSEALGELLGRVSRASDYARALAPASFSAMLAIGLTRGGAILVLALITCFGLGAYAMALRLRPREVE